MCLTAHGLAAALLLAKEFPLESPCEDSAFLAFFLRNCWNILFINSVGSTLVTTDVVSTFVHKLFMGGFCPALCQPAFVERQRQPQSFRSQKPPRGTVLAVLHLSPVPCCTYLENMALAPISGCPAVDLVCKEELKCQDGPFPKGERGRSML